MAHQEQHFAFGEAVFARRADLRRQLYENYQEKYGVDWSKYSFYKFRFHCEVNYRLGLDDPDDVEELGDVSRSTIDSDESDLWVGDPEVLGSQYKCERYSMESMEPGMDLGYFDNYSQQRDGDLPEDLIEQILAIYRDHDESPFTIGITSTPLTRMRQYVKENKCRHYFLLRRNTSHGEMRALEVAIVEWCQDQDFLDIRNSRQNPQGTVSKEFVSYKLYMAL